MSDEEQTSNIFDENKRPKTGPVPVVVQIGKDKRVVGEAQLEVTGSGIGVTMNLNTDDPADALKFLQGGVTGISIDDEQRALSYAEAEALFEFEAHEHKPVQHRDAKPPWCNVCKLTVDFSVPESSIPKPGPSTNRTQVKTHFGFPQPPGAIHIEKKHEN